MAGANVGSGMKGTLRQLSISSGGMPKLPVESAEVTATGVGADWQTNRKYHGGPDRAVCLFSVELYDGLRSEHGIDLVPGSLGENFTTEGFDLMALKPGRRLRVGRCVIEVTDIRVPCRNLNRWHPSLMKIVQGRSGWVCRVNTAATVRPGDAIEVL
jgi:MOSC domain-containing protein YiiM